MKPLLSLLKSDKPEKPAKNGHAEKPHTPAQDHTKPHLDSVTPSAAMPGGEVTVLGSNLGPTPHLPSATIGDVPVPITFSRPTRVTLKIPEGTISGDILLHNSHQAGTHFVAQASNPLPLRVAVPMAENLHPVSNPAVDADGNVYATVSGSRGQQVPVSIFCIQRDLQVRPYVRDLLNATGLAFGPDGYLYCSSRADGVIYRVESPDSLGEATVFTYAEGLGIATGIAFDAKGNLFVGDRTGTIFRIAPPKPSAGNATLESPTIFVHATLEPSMAAYHLAFNSAGTLFVTGPTTSSNQAIHAIDPDGNTSLFYQGLGRAQGMAFDVDDNLYVAASLHGQRGIVRITPNQQASLVISGQNLVGLAFLEDGCAALATREALYHVGLDIQGRPLP
jgi:sugar lactone lactonase YvrE